jgi:undecaprenyl-diphosphatase
MKKYFKFILCTAILLALSFLFDMQIAKFIAGIQIPFIAALMSILSFLGKWYILPFIAVLVILASKMQKKYKYISASLTSLLLGFFIATITKIIVARPRPFQALATRAVQKFTEWGSFQNLTIQAVQKIAEWDSSFFSSHAMGVFAVLPLLDKKIRPYWLAFAILVCFSRLYLSMHYLSDVIVGALVGYLCGLLSLKLFKLK